MAFVILSATWLRIGDLSSLPPGLSSDESMNANDAFHIYQVGPARFPFYENYGEPEPLFRLILSALVPFLGPHIWTFRLVAALIGVGTVAAACWATRQVLAGHTVGIRWAASALAAASLAAALGHITITRSLYRAAPLPLFILLFIGFLLRSLRRRRWIDLIISAISLSLCYYTYTAGFIVPLAFGPFILGLFLFERKSWKAWATSLAIVGLIAAVVLTPVGYLLIKSPQRVLGRAAEVTGTSVVDAASAFNTISGRILTTGRNLALGAYSVLFINGDSNVQYNTDRAPVIPFMFQPLFASGVLALFTQWRRPQTWLLISLIFITAAPAVLSQEAAHGLRITGAFGIFPLIAGAGAGGLLSLAARQPVRLRVALHTLLAVVTVWGMVWARQTYVGFWQRPSSIIMFGRDLTYGEWFFRPDQRDFAQWIAAQQAPVLVPLDQLVPQTTRAWLLASYPNVTAADNNFTMPPDTLAVIPWVLELGDYNLNTRHYALLQNHTITLLPPLTEETHNALAANLASAQRINRPNGNAMAKIITPPAGFRFDFESRRVAATLGQPLAAQANGLVVTGWWGPKTVSRDSEQTVTYTLEWATRYPQRHDYRSFVGLLTYNNERKAGVDAEMTRWLYPTWTWQPDTPTPVTYTFTVPAGLDPGAYRLALIMDDQLTTIGWVKVPQANLPAPDAGNVHPDAVFDNSFTMYGASAKDEGNGNVRISFYWQSNVERSVTDAIIFIHAQTKDGQLVAQADAQPWLGQYPTFIWSKGERVRTDYSLNIGSTPITDVEVWVGMYTFPSLVRLTVIQNDTPVKDNRLHVGSLVALLGR
ncbi:MAG: hypothetical protein AAB382_09805 [Chloroflexota bacterium]